MCLPCKNKILECIDDLTQKVTGYKTIAPPLQALLAKVQPSTAQELVQTAKIALLQILTQMRHGKQNVKQCHFDQATWNAANTGSGDPEQQSLHILIQWLTKAVPVLFVGIPCLGVTTGTGTVIAEQKRLLLALLRINSAETMSVVVLAALISSYKNWNYGTLPECKKCEDSGR